MTKVPLSPQSNGGDGGHAQRLRVVVRGAVQGVGFRPFVHRLASELTLKGYVTNTAQGVTIEVEAERSALEQFLCRLVSEKPPPSFIQSLETWWLDTVGFDGFEIRASVVGGEKSAIVLPDIATCPYCVREIFDPANRRFRYPFTNCTHCGPRFSIITALPYDRANTSMNTFVMCSECEAEYHDPVNRRFHAQPNACPECGPRVTFCDAAGRAIAEGNEALLACIAAIRAGQIAAIKGVGGFHLMADATREAAITRLRQRKHRDEKPLAVMFPTFDSIRECCEINEAEERLLRSQEAPIVLVRRSCTVVGAMLPLSPDLVMAQQEIRPTGLVAPNNPYLGVMLPYTPLHHLLMAELNRPCVATSGNLSDEPICTDNDEAFERLAGIADVFLVHDRPIIRHVDDSVVRVMMGRELVLRRARGFAPLPVRISTGAGGPVLAVGAHLKNTVALAVGSQVFISQHIGDLETEPALKAFSRVAADLQRLYEAPAVTIAADLHPDYLSTKFAREQPARTVLVQHHYAHVLSCMAENELVPPVLGVAWDGTGYGPDGTIWGGEFLLVNESGFSRAASLRPFRLPGGDAAVREPRRAALAVMFDVFGASLFDQPLNETLRSFLPGEMATLRRMLEIGLNSPLTSSMGRLFDAVSSLIGLRHNSRFEGQAAMELEFAAAQSDDRSSYEFALSNTGQCGDEPSYRPRHIIDWHPVVRGIVADSARNESKATMAARFHNTLACVIVSVARRVSESRVVLSGGCFQNRELVERAVPMLRAAGFKPYWHQRIPPNDGGIALGQVVAAKLS